MGFDPDAYLAENSGGFDPDAYLAENEESTDPLVSGVRKFAQGGSVGFSDELAGLAEGAGKAVGLKGLGGPVKDISVDDNGASLDWDILKEAYKRARDKERETLKKDAKENPVASGIGELGGAIMSPINKIMPGASMAKSGAAIGAATGLGASESDNLGGLAADTAMGGIFGAGIGKAGDMASPYIAKGAGAIGGVVNKGKQALGQKLNDAGEVLAYTAAGPMLKDFRAAASRGRIGKIGRYMLDNGLKAGDSVDDVAEKFAAQNETAGKTLESIYAKASVLFKDKMNKVGFDPLRDKAEIMAAAKAELGDTVGADGALAKLGKYLDQVAGDHGDAPMQAAMREYQSQMDEFIPKQEQFLKQKQQYEQAIGKAGQDLDQPVLPSAYDDLQRTSLDPRQVELYGQSPNQMYAEGSEFGTQMALPSLPQRPPEGFNMPHGDDLLPFQQQMRLDEIGSNKMLSHSEQGNILGTELVPRTYQNVETQGVKSGIGQLEFPIAPNAPTMPQMPADIRNPMSPRRANDIKGAIDDEINYSRNPFAKEPASEKAFSGARRKIQEKVEQGIEDLGGGEVVEALKKANQEYGYTKELTRMATDREGRNSVNKMFGLTDTITGSAAIGYGAVTEDWQGSLAIMAAKKGVERWGTSTLAVAADRLGKQLLKSPQMQKVAVETPKVFAGMVYNLVQKAEGGAAAFPRAADSQPESAMNFQESSGKDALLKKTQGSKYEQVLRNAAEKGEESMSAAHFVLSSQDPEYKRLIDGDDQ